MEVITDSKLLQRKLIGCLSKYPHFSFATAWASADTDLFRAIKRKIQRLRHGVIGIHFFQTDPDVLDYFVGSKQVRFMLQPAGTFHPKVMVFWGKQGWELFVGSANLTRGGLSINTELTVRTVGQAGDDKAPCRDVRRSIADWKAQAKVMSQPRADHYRATQPIRRAALDRVEGSYGKPSKRPVIDSPVMTYSWEEFRREVRRRGGGKDVAPRLKLLNRVGTAFADIADFAAMPRDVRMTIAGMPGSKQPLSGWFGNMGAARKFWPALNYHVPQLSKALDSIPLGGDVTRSQFDAYVASYKRAFPDGGWGIGTATRLLAMKRPDQFVCLDTANLKGLCKEFGIPVAGMSLDRYWDEVIERVRDTPWWLSPRPTRGRDLQIWEGRVAMLDAIFYEIKPPR